MKALSNLWKKFARSKKYRDAFVIAYLKRSIPFQIAAIREKRGWSQEQLAEASGLTQGVISRAENPNYGNLTFNTALRIASGLDVAFVGEFIPFSELARRVANLSEESVQAPTFKEENDAISREHEEPQRGSIALAIAAAMKAVFPAVPFAMEGMEFSVNRGIGVGQGSTVQQPVSAPTIQIEYGKPFTTVEPVLGRELTFTTPSSGSITMPIEVNPRGREFSHGRTNG